MMKRESRDLEYKLKVTDSFLKTVTAYANYGEGKIVFGIDDSGGIIGIEDIENASLKIENKINDNIFPRPRYELEIDKNIIILTVEEGDYKPYTYRNKAYTRNDSATIEVDREELNRLILLGSNLNYEDLGAKNQKLSFNYLENKLKESLNINALNKDILKTLDLYSDDLGYNRAAELLSDVNEYPGVDIVVFGDNINEFNYRETIKNISLIEQFDLSMENYKKHYKYESIKGSKREKKERIPEVAFREALANALVHRLWDLNANIRVSMYKDKIEIISPGPLMSGISIEEYLDGMVSIFRNPKISNVFFRLRYIEKFGTGISRIKKSYNESLIKPEFKFYENSISVILPNIVLGLNGFNKEDKMVINELRNNILSRAQLEEKLGFNKAKMIRVLNKLVEKNIVDKIGKGRSIRYKLK